MERGVKMNYILSAGMKGNGEMVYKKEKVVFFTNAHTIYRLICALMTDTYVVDRQFFM